MQWWYGPKTMPKHTPIRRNTQLGWETQSVRFVLLYIHFQHKYNHLIRMNNGIFLVWIFAHYFISRLLGVWLLCGLAKSLVEARTRFTNGRESIAFCMQTKWIISSCHFAHDPRRTAHIHVCALAPSTCWIECILSCEHFFSFSPLSHTRSLARFNFFRFLRQTTDHYANFIENDSQ